MITLTRLNGPRFTINSDLVQRIEVTPDTVIHLADGACYIVEEPLDDVVTAIIRFRARVLATAHLLASDAPTSPGLRVVSDRTDNECEV